MLSLWQNKKEVFDFYQSQEHRTYKKMVGRKNITPVLSSYSERLVALPDDEPVIVMNYDEGR